MNNEINKIHFGILSSQEIEAMSVCEIKNSRLISSSDTSNVLYHTVYDPRMGILENNQKCETCKENLWQCVGHFGHIKLNIPVINPLYIKFVVNILKIVCKSCYRVLLTSDLSILNNISKFKGIKKFNKLIEKIDKIEHCAYCKEAQPVIKYSTIDNIISSVFTNKNDKISIVMNVPDILKILTNITDQDVLNMGFDPAMMHPRNLIFINFPVIPPSCRPYVIADSTTCDDDLTIQLIEIIKINNHLIDDETNNCETKRSKYTQALKFRISTYFNNSSGRAKHSTNGRSIKGIKERLTGKDGLIRSNLLGKRVEQSGRTVIGPDPTLKVGQVAIPRVICKNLTVPVHVTSFNINYLTQIVNNGEANYILKNDIRINLDNAINFRGTILSHGDVINRNGVEHTINNGKEMLKQGDILIRNGKIIKDIIYPCKKDITLTIGDIVERHLINGDIVLINRQPTLHEGSMMAQEVVVSDNKTIQFNLAITKSFNADFDGDEMNLHVPQSLEAEAELRFLSKSKYKMISSQSSKPNLCIVQDSLLGAYLMTINDDPIDKSKFFDITMSLVDISSNIILKKIEMIKSVRASKGLDENPYNGKGLISLLFKDNFNYTKTNNGGVTVKIENGVLYEGYLDKSILGSISNSLIHIIYKEYGDDIACEFIDGIHFVTNGFLCINSFSIGLGDCMIEDENKVDDINCNINKCIIEAKGIEGSTSHKGIREVRVLAALNRAKDIGLKIAKESLDPSNNFLSTVISGSKGDMFNIMQISGLLGQQNINGNRIGNTLNNNKRSLVHYPFEIKDDLMRYESNGFINRSFVKGLTPRQFYFHSMAGRDGCIDTAMNTSTSGYIQRRIVKLTEDLKIQYDGTVRDNIGSILQLSYGGSNIDPKEMIKVNGKLQFVDVKSMIQKLNDKYEKK